MQSEHLYHYILLNVLAKQHLKDVRYYRPYERGKNFCWEEWKEKISKVFYYVLLFEYSNHCQKQGRSHTGAKAGLLQSSLKHTLSFFTLT